MTYSLRRSRLIALSLVLLLVAACWWAWRDKDNLAIALVNPLLSGSEITELRGLQLGPGQIGLVRVTLLFESGAELELHDIQLQRPFDLLFGPDSNRSRLDVAQLLFTPAPQSPDQQATKKEVVPTTGPEESELRLSQLSHMLQRYLPQSVFVQEMHSRGAKWQLAALKLERDYSDDSMEAELSSGDKRLHLHLRRTQRQLDITARLAAERTVEIISLSGKVEALDDGDWLGQFNAHTDLQQLRTLPPPEKLQDAAATASGELKVQLTGRIPDQLLKLGDYRDLAVRLSSDSSRFTIPQDLLGTALTVSLATTEAVTATAASVKPLAIESIAGQAELQITTADPSQRLLRASLDTSSTNGTPRLVINGELNLQAASPLLQAPRVQQKISPFTLKDTAGNIVFSASAKLAPLDQLASGTVGSPQEIAIQLAEGSEAKFTLGEKVTEKALLQLLGWTGADIDVQFAKTAKITAAQWPGPLALNTQKVQISAKHPKEQSGIKTDLSKLECKLDSEFRCTAAVNTTLNKITLKTSGATLDTASIQGRLHFSHSDSGQQWQLQQAEMDAGPVHLTAAEIAGLSLHSPEIRCTQLDGEVHCESERIELSTTGFESAQLTASGPLALTAINFRQQDDSTRLSARYGSEGMELKALGRYSANTTLNGHLELAADVVQGKGQISAGSLTINNGWRYDLQSQSGAARVALLPTDFSQESPLSRSITGLPVDIVSGSIGGDGQLSWPTGNGDKLNLKLEQVAATYNDSFAVGISGELSAQQHAGQWITGGAQPVSIETLDVGIPIQDIHFSVELDEQQDLALRDLRAKLLDGTLQSEQLLWNLEGKTRRSEVDLKGISLKKLTTEMEAENFAASGILDLSIPLITDKNGITVEQGHVEARPPGGRLRYYGAFSPGMLASNPQLKLIAGALEDYNYRELSGTVEYPPSGDMQMNLKLVGRSDSVAVDRDLIINLNLENNVPDMLRSLQATRDLTEALEKQVQ